MSAIFDQLVSYLEKEGWPLDKSKADEGWVLSRFKGDNGAWMVIAHVSKPSHLDGTPFELFVFRSILDQSVPPDRNGPIQEFVCRSNYCTSFGYLDFDVTDGELSFWTGNFCNERDDLRPIFHELVTSNVATMDQVYPAIMRVIYGNVSPESALLAIDSDTSTSSEGNASPK